MSTAFKTRFGMYAQKLGMSRIFIGKKAVPVTLLKVPASSVINKVEKEDHTVLTLGVKEFKTKVKKPQAKHLERMNLPLCGLVKEFKVTKEEAASINESLTDNWIEIGSVLDVQSKSAGKGFAGVMKRWNFSGSNATHGASLSHRSLGSTGTRDKIFKNRKMPGRLGNETITVQNQKVVFKDQELGIVALSGSVPGKPGTWVRISKAIKGSGEGYGN